MVSNLIEKHQLIAAKIESATANDDFDLLLQLDKEYNSVWSELLSIHPETDQEKTRLISYLLDQIPEVDEAKLNAREISEKILSLI